MPYRGLYEVSSEDLNMTRQDGDGRVHVTVIEFADYVEDITRQLAKTAEALALPRLAGALQDAQVAAVLERSRHSDEAH